MDLTTPEGITIAELRSASGEELSRSSAPAECTGTLGLPVGSSPSGFEGELSGPPSDTTTSVVRSSVGARFEG
jgi:hypothetical protein